MSGRRRTRAYAAIGQPPQYFRATTFANATIELVDREAGVAGALMGLSIAARGEAKGHGMFLDQTFLESLVAGSTAHDLKARYTHPGISSDGLGTLLGRLKNFRLDDDGDLVRADLFFVQSAHDTPNGDLADYVMRLADESPDLAGMSIVFERDIGAEDAFRGEHSDEEGKFTSPDSSNTKNYQHVRLAEFRGADLVDDPAATDGMFAADDGVLQEVEAAVDYALGRTTNKPEGAIFNIDPQRLRNYMEDYFARKNLAVVQHFPERTLVVEGDGSGRTLPPIEHTDLETAQCHTVTPGDDSPVDDNQSATDTGADKQEEGSEMESLEKLTVIQLQQARPDLVTALTEPAEKAAYEKGITEERERALTILSEAATYELPIESAKNHIQKGFGTDKALADVTREALEASRAAMAKIKSTPETPKAEKAPEDYYDRIEAEVAKLQAADPQLSYAAAMEEASTALGPQPEALPITEE